MLKVKKSVLPEELLLNETEKKLLEEEEKKYGTKLMEMPTLFLDSQRRDGFLYSEAGTPKLQWTDARRADYRTAG